MTPVTPLPASRAPGTATGPRPTFASLWVKLGRAFLVAFVGGLLTALLPIADQIAAGTNVSFSLLGSLAIGAIAGALAAAVRAVIAFLPLFADDNNIGMRRN